MEKIGEGMLYDMTQTSSLDFVSELPFTFLYFSSFTFNNQAPMALSTKLRIELPGKSLHSKRSVSRPKMKGFPVLLFEKSVCKFQMNTIEK